MFVFTKLSGEPHDLLVLEVVLYFVPFDIWFDFPLGEK